MPLTLQLQTPILDDRPVFISGPFCQWYPDVQVFKMNKIGEGKYEFTFSDLDDSNQQLEYKYTKGAWDAVELDEYGDTPANRSIKKKAGLRKDFVPNWRVEGKNFVSSRFPIYEIVSENFEIPQLNKTRKITALLPYDYYNSTKNYPVLYLQDAQNLMGEGSDFGNWEIDKRLSLMSLKGTADCIIIAIDNAGQDRTTEYVPYQSKWLGKGSGKKYATFLAKTLKPFIDSKYRTKVERSFCGVGGSSLGGLISIYAGLMFPEVFGKLMIFSPSLWVSSKIYFDAIEFIAPLATKIYIYAGTNESKTMVESVEKLKQTIENQGYSRKGMEVKLSINPNGKHNESQWGREFPKALEWLFFSDTQ